MDTTALVAAWLMEKNNNDQQKVLQEAVTLLSAASSALPEFQSWLTTKKTVVQSLATPEALDAVRVQRQAALAAELTAINAAIAVAIPDVPAEPIP